MINIININEYKKEREINVTYSKWIYGIWILNSKIIKCDYYIGLNQWKIEGDNIILIRKEMVHFSYYINAILNLGNGYLIVCLMTKLLKYGKLFYII